MDLSDVKRYYHKDVCFKGIKYTLTGCILRKSLERGFYYQAELLDKTQNSIMICLLDDVKAIPTYAESSYGELNKNEEG